MDLLEQLMISHEQSMIGNKYFFAVSRLDKLCLQFLHYVYRQLKKANRNLTVLSRIMVWINETLQFSNKRYCMLDDFGLGSQLTLSALPTVQKQIRITSGHHLVKHTLSKSRFKLRTSLMRQGKQGQRAMTTNSVFACNTWL